MADNVIIKDAEGNDVVYENASEVELTTEDGGTAVYVHSDEIPEQVQADWDNTTPSAKSFIKNKPFGVLPDIIPEQELTFVLDDEDESIRTCRIAFGQPIVIGETYKVAWDGVTYELVAKDTKDVSTGSLGVVIESSPYLGNSNISGLAFGMTDWGEDTGEPFLIGFNASNNNTVTINTTDLVNTTHTVSIVPANKMKKLSAEWLPDGLATEDFVKDQIAAIDIPEGSESSGTGLPDATADDSGKVLTVGADGTPGWQTPSGGSSVSTETVIYAEDTWNTVPSENYGAYALAQEFDETVPAFPLALGDECVVVWDGVEYSVTVFDSSSVIANTLFVGNGSFYNLPGNDEPFCIAWDSAGVTFFSIPDTESTEHTVRIYQQTPLSVSWENVTDKPFGEELVTIFEGTFQDTLVDNDGDGVNDKWSNDMTIEDTSDTNLEVGETYIVTWGGVEYSCEAFDFLGLPALGNKMLFGVGANSGEPFAILRDTIGKTGIVGWWAMNFIPPTDLTISGAYDVKIASYKVKTLDPKYLDDIDYEKQVINKPFGIIPSGTVVVEERSVSTMLDNPTDMATFGATSLLGLDPGAYDVVWENTVYTCSGKYTNSIYSTNSYCLGNLSLMPDAESEDDTGEPFVMIEVPEYSSTIVLVSGNDSSGTYRFSIKTSVDKIKQIQESYIPDSVKLPTVTAADNGKILMVVDGAWAVVDFPTT